MIRIKSLKTKIIILAMVCLVLTAAIVTAYSVNFLSDRAVDDAKEQLLTIARAKALNIQAEMVLGLNSSHTLSKVLARVKDHDNPIDLQRYETIDLLEGILNETPRFYGIFTCWEPKAYDYLDSGFVNERGHDGSGRFAPYWRRTNQNDLRLSPFLTSPYHSVGGQPREWYEAIRKSKSHQVLDPIKILDKGEEHLIASAIAPIIPHNQFTGVVGVDIDLSFLQTIADGLKIFDDSGTMTIASNNGTVVAFTGKPENIAKNILHVYPDSLNLDKKIRLGKESVEISEGLLYAFAPVNIGQTEKPWSVGAVVPINKIVAAPTSLMWKLIVIFGGITGIVFIVAYLGALSFTRPLSNLVKSMKSIRNGDFSQELTIRSQDEIGEVAAVFNLMRIKLEQTLNELQDHQEKLEEKVLQRTLKLNEMNSALNKANIELNQAMQTIRETQDQLLQNEKLAVVGQMSGIVAHEVLNPVAAVSIRIETNIGQAQRTMAVIKKLNDAINSLQKAYQEKYQEDCIPSYQENMSMIIKIGDSLLKNQEERLKDLHFLEKQTGRIVKIIDNLRQMSKTRKHIEQIHLKDLVNEVFYDMDDGLRKRNIQVTKELEQVPPIPADHTELYSIVSNLIRNAMESLEKRDRKTQRLLTAALKLRDDNFLELTIRDNGIGIAPENRQLIFEPGYTSKGRQGTGLGLSFSRNVARSYHGDIILLEQENKQGAGLQVLLPVKQENA